MSVSVKLEELGPKSLISLGPGPILSNVKFFLPVGSLYFDYLQVFHIKYSALGAKKYVSFKVDDSSKKLKA